MIASLNSRETLDVVARPNIKRPEELRGKKFGIQSIGGGVWKTAAVWLEHFGLDEKRDNIQMIVIGDVTVLSQAVETGRIDATVVPGFLSRRLRKKASMYSAARTRQNSLLSVWPSSSSRYICSKMLKRSKTS